MSEYPYAPPEHLAYLTQYADFGDAEVTVERAGACPNCGSDNIEYAGMEDAHDPHQGEVVLCHDCGQWCPEEELEAQDDDADDQESNNTVDWDDDDDKTDEGESEENPFGDGPPSVPKKDKIKRSKTAASEPYSFQGAVSSVGSGHAEGIAVRPDTQSKEEIMAMLDQLLPAHHFEQEHVKNQYAERGLGDRPYSYDNPFVNRGGKVADTLPKTTPTYPEEFSGEGFIIVANITEPNHIYLFVHPACRGAIAGTGGMTSHSAVVARGLNQPCIVDAKESSAIQPGDHIEMILQSQDGSGDGVVNVNGGSPDFVAGPGVQARYQQIIFIYIDGQGYSKDISQVPDEQRNNPENTHTGALIEPWMAANPDKAGDWYMSGVMGVIYDNGDADIYPPMMGTYDHAAVEEFIHSIAPMPIKSIDVTQFGQAVAHAITKRAEHNDELGSALNCPNCGSHSYRTVHLRSDDKSDFQCLACKGTYKQKVFRVGSHKFAKLDKGQRILMLRPERSGQRGTILKDNGTDDNFGDELYDILLDNGEELTKVPDSAFKKIKSAALADVPVAEGIDTSQDWFESGYEGHPVMCYMCGNTRTAGLGTQCEHCGFVLSIRRDGPAARAKWAKTAAGEELEVGQWYTMSSPEYEVPDVIKVLEVEDEGITAAIEGDDKGLFPLLITSDEAEKNTYTFEPYELPEDIRSEAHFFESKTARRSHSVREQQDLINENPEGRARNFDKLDLEGTHYDMDELESTSSYSDDGITRAFLW